jgi:uncharacterized protein
VVEEIAGLLSPDLSARDRLMVLLHDAPEYVIGDMISPFKAVMGGDYKAVERRLLAAIHLRFALPPEPPAAVTTLAKKADRVAAYFEAVELAGFDPDEARRIFGLPRGIGRQSPIGPRFGLEPWPTVEAQERFLERFRTIERFVGQ